MGAFHRAHTLQLCAHAPTLQRELAVLVERAETLSRRDFALRYRAGFAQTLACRATPAAKRIALRSVARALDADTLDSQVYLHPHPAERAFGAAPVLGGRG